MDNYSIGIKLINDNHHEEDSISVIYLCDQIQKEITIISYYQIQKTRTIDISNVDSFCDVYFVISQDCFLKIINDYEQVIPWDISLKNFLIRYDLLEWLI